MEVPAIRRPLNVLNVAQRLNSAHGELVEPLERPAVLCERSA